MGEEHCFNSGSLDFKFCTYLDHVREKAEIIETKIEGIDLLKDTRKLVRL